jgi:hypothetical protein
MRCGIKLATRVFERQVMIRVIMQVALNQRIVVISLAAALGGIFSSRHRSRADLCRHRRLRLADRSTTRSNNGADRPDAVSFGDRGARPKSSLAPG